SRSAVQGSTVELRRGDHVIVARVVWRDGARVGLRTDERLPVEEIISLEQAQVLRLTGVHAAVAERRTRRRAAVVDARLRGRAMEFVSVGIIAASMAVTVWSMAEQALARPMAAVAAALGG